MKKWVFILSLVLVSFLNGESQSLSQDRIKEIASLFLQTKTNNKSLSENDIVWENYEKNDTSLLIMAHNKHDFVILANDIRVKPILGYSDEGTFDEGNIPPQLRDLLVSYQTEILNVKRGLAKVPQKYNTEWDNLKNGIYEDQKTAVAPIIKVTWNQGSGWNRFCPEDIEGPGGHVYAGCVAVSMAQSMSVFKHPDTGVGESGYLADSYGYLSVNYGDTEYNWDLMSTTSSDDYNALLLYHCAVSVQMGFSPDGSGAYTRDIAKALKNHFDYSSSVYYANSTEDQAWIDLLKSEIDAGRPISYGGNNGSDVGHAFNLDGYNTSDAFHVNWGWSGAYNGYFQIASLTPNGSDYSKNATAILNIMPMDHAPYDIELSKTVIKEKTPLNEVAAIINVMDPDENDVHSLVVKGANSIFGDGYCPFYIDGDSLKIKEIIEFEQFEKVYIQIIAKDLQGNEFAKDFTINIERENNIPTDIRLSNLEIEDTLSIGSFVGVFSTIDADNVDTFKYEFEITPDPNLSKDNDKFILSNDSLVTNYEFKNYTDNECSIVIKSTDWKGESVSKEFILSINKTTGGVSGVEVLNEIRLYPNPTSQFLNISIKQGQINSVEIYDILGNIKSNIEINDVSSIIDLNEYEAGLYFININSENGQRSIHKIVLRK